MRIAGPLDAAVVVRGVQDAVARHELLRTTFPSTGTCAAQVILDSYTPDVPILERPAVDSESEWRDLQVRPPVRPELVRIADDNHILRLRGHRILADGYSM